MMCNENLHGQQALGAPARKVVGVMDPKTGAFTPLVTTEESHPDMTTTPATTGTISLAITIKLASTDLAKSSIMCRLDLSATSISLTTDAVGVWQDSVGALATISGSMATCTLTLPYSWVIPASASSVLNTLGATFEVDATGGTTTAPVFLRSTYQDLFSGAKIPASGTTTAYTANVTL